MGSLTIPPSGAVYVDTSMVIYSVEKHPDFWPLLRPLWAASQQQKIELVSSELTLLEALVGPLKATDTVLCSAYEQLLLATEMRLLPVTLDVLREAAQLRATLNLRTPDALHAATALSVGCTLFITHDTDFRRVPQLPVAVLKDIATT